MKCKCADCGYLATRNQKTRQLNEVERNDNGHINFVWYGHGLRGYAEGNPIYDNPICFARAATLWDEYRLEPMDPGIDNNEQNRIRHVLENERDCKSFTKWLQGFTPKEHREMIDRKRERIWHIIEIIAIAIATIGAGVAGFVLNKLVK
jgi:hypothetical protein